MPSREGGRPHLLSWVFGEPLNHVLQFPETDRVAAESFPGSWFAWTATGAEERAGVGEPSRAGGGQNFQIEATAASQNARDREGVEGGLAAGEQPQERRHLQRKKVMKVLPQYSLGELLMCESSVTKIEGKLQLAGCF